MWEPGDLFWNPPEERTKNAAHQRYKFHPNFGTNFDTGFGRKLRPNLRSKSAQKCAISRANTFC